MNIAILGAGAAGLMSVRIYERSRRSHEAGMGFILMETALVVDEGV